MFTEGKKEIVLECGRKFGKQICLDETILTPLGFIRYGDLSIGDVVYDESGNEQFVTGLSDINISPESYRVHFCSGTYIDACADHKWVTHTKLDRKAIKRKDRGSDPNRLPTVKTTREIKDSLMHGKEFNHSIPYSKPVKMKERDFLLDPYLLGCWLGDGGSHAAKITSVDEEILDAFRSSYGLGKSDKCTYGIIGNFSTVLKKLNLIKNKHIPSDYLISSEDQRLALLQGLMDTDGTINKAGNHCCFDNTNKDLADGVFYLVASLGMKPMMSQRIGKLYGVEKKLCYRVQFKPRLNVFRLSRKTNKIIVNNIKTMAHTIVGVEKIESKPMMCISVSGKSHLYLIGRSLIPTHNTDTLCYSLYRWALTHPGTFNYYFAPFKDQIKDLVWANGRLPHFFPDHLAKKYIESINNTEMRIVFKNGSYIRCDGSDNFEKSRGYSATGLTCYDEAKDFHMQFHDSFDPNRAITDAPLLAVGTPGHGGDLLSKLWDQANVTKTGSAFRMPSHMNPYISADYLERKKEEHIARDEYDVYLMEYEAKRIKLGTKFVFPMLDKSKHMRSYDELLSYVKENRKDFDFYTGYDPGSAKCFAVGFFAIHRFNKHIIQLDEIYITKLGKNSTRQVVPICMDKWDEINKSADDWQDCYDYAAAWFSSEICYEYPDYPHALFPCTKDLKNKENKMSLMKDILINGLFTFSDRCIKSFWEWENHKLNDKGVLIKENDHCFIGSTKISTSRGLIDINKVNKYDYVETRSGFNEVIKVFNNGKKSISRLTISNGTVLHLTEDHKIYTLNRGFVEAKNLTMDDILCTEKLSKLSLMVSYLNDGRSRSLLVCEAIIDVFKEKMELNISTGKYGNLLMEKYLLAMKSIIQTGIHLITKYPIFSSSQWKSMKESMQKKDLYEQDQKSTLKHLKELDLSPKSGMDQMREDVGTLNTQKKTSQKESLKNITVKIAQWNSVPGLLMKIKLNFARTIASQSQEDSLESMMKIELALFAIRFLELIGIREKSTVHAIALKRNIGKANVYDLMINENHEYFANHVLVHNCLDLTRYILNLANYYTIEDARPIDFKIKYNKGTFEQDEIRRSPEEGYGSFDIANAD